MYCNSSNVLTIISGHVNNHPHLSLKILVETYRIRYIMLFTVSVKQQINQIRVKWITKNYKDPFTNLIHLNVSSQIDLFL